MTYSIYFESEEGKKPKEDTRYSVKAEWCGHLEPKYIPRYCGNWIEIRGKQAPACDTQEEAAVWAYLHRVTRQSIGDLFYEQMDAGDIWGSAMSWTFDLCEYLYYHGYDIPPELQFHPGVGSPRLPDEWYGLESASGDTPLSLYYHAQRMSQLLDACTKAGMDY